MSWSDWKPSNNSYLTNVKEMLSILYPLLPDFCGVYNLSIPTLNEVLELKSTTTFFVNCTGHYSVEYKAIMFSEQLKTPEEFLTVLAHELCHAVQHYTHKDTFEQLTKDSVQKWTYEHCPLEHQAIAFETSWKGLSDKKIGHLIKLAQEAVDNHMNEVW